MKVGKYSSDLKQLFFWENEFDRNRILKKIALCRRITDNKCSFDAFEHAFWTPVLNSSLRADRLVGALKSVCIDRAISEPATDLQNPEEFPWWCSNHFYKLCARRSGFVVAFHLTYTGQLLFNRVSDGDGTVVWTARGKLLNVILKARKGVAGLLDRRELPHPVPKSTVILVHVNAVNAFDAQSAASDLIDRVRGVLNLLVNSQRSINIFGHFARRHAVNRFRVGPYSTVHHPDGSLAAKVIWYEPHWHHEHESVKFSGKPEDTRRKIRVWWERANSNPLKDTISEALLRYCRALDQEHPVNVLLGLWSTLELLTGTQREKYDVTVARVSRVFDDFDDARLIAQHIRIQRNSTVHAAASPEQDEADVIILQAERLVSRLLSFYIREGKKFRNQRDLINFLDLSFDPAELTRQKELIDDFLKFRKQSQIGDGRS